MDTITASPERLNRVARLEAINPPEFDLPNEDLYWETVLMQLALQSEAGRTLGFFLELRADFGPAAKTAKKTYSTWVKERFSHRLRPLERRIGRNLLYWFAVELEVDSACLYGSIAADGGCIDELRSILQGLSESEDDPFEIIDHFLFLGMQGAFAWVNYCVKDVVKTRQRTPGSPIVCCRELKAAVVETRAALRSNFRLRQFENAIRSHIYEAVESEALIQIAAGPDLPPTNPLEKPTASALTKLRGRVRSLGNGMKSIFR